jgi:hypothetical protein
MFLARGGEENGEESWKAQQECTVEGREDAGVE